MLLLNFDCRLFGTIFIRTIILNLKNVYFLHGPSKVFYLLIAVQVIFSSIWIFFCKSDKIHFKIVRIHTNHLIHLKGKHMSNVNHDILYGRGTQKSRDFYEFCKHYTFKHL